MSILPPLSSPLLTQERLAEILASDILVDPYPHLLRWLIWFPLLSAEELTCLEQARLAKQGRTHSPQRVAALLHKLESYQLLAHLVVNEPGWPPHQYRYFLTDAGLSVFAAQSNPTLSVPRLAQAYAVERTDLIARLARIDIHLALATLSTSLVVDGRMQGYLLTSFQQPWMQTDSMFGHRQTLRCDAAFLLADPQGAEHAFYVRVDTNERCPFDRHRERVLLARLLNLRHSLSLEREAMPRLLILTGASRLSEWGILLEKICEQQGTALLAGGITTLEYLRRSGVHGMVWWPFAELAQSMRNSTQATFVRPSARLAALMGAAASSVLAERFSQRRTFEHLLTKHPSGPLRKTSRPLLPYVGKSLASEIASLHPASLADALRGTKAEQQEATALLNLALSATQKDLIFWLTHHPLFTLDHLATLHYPGGRDVRSVQRQIKGLAALNFLVPFQWHRARSWRERERYVLTEAALRYSALREDKLATFYLLPEEKKKRYHSPALSIQQGTAGLLSQMEHTHGLYTCMALLIEAAYHEKVRILTWKSASEIIRSYPDPLTHVSMQVRPDAELIYQLEGQEAPHHLLVEYDRATTTEREITAKYQTYADYLDATRLALPPILVITQHERAATLIRTCIDRTGSHLPIIIVLENQIQRQGLLSLLARLDRSS